MKNKQSVIKIVFITILSIMVVVPFTKSYFSDYKVITGNIFSTGYWEEEKEELIVELKKPLDSHQYFLGQSIQILWKIKNAHPKSEFTFKLFLLDEDRELIEELDMSDMECGPPAKAPIYEKWCTWDPLETGNYIIKVEVSDEDGAFGHDENEDFFTIEEKPSQKPNSPKNSLLDGEEGNLEPDCVDCVGAPEDTNTETLTS